MSGIVEATEISRAETPSILGAHKRAPARDNIPQSTGAGCTLRETPDQDTMQQILQLVQSLHEKVDRLSEGNGRQTTRGCMSTEQAAAYVGLTARAVRVAAEQMRLHGRKIGTSRKAQWRFSRADLDMWLKAVPRTPQREVSIWKN